MEEQARGSLHFHVVYWGELTANLLQSAATYAVLLGAVAKALDGMVKAEVDSVQVEHLINNFEGIVPHKPAISNAHNPTRYSEQFYQDLQQTVFVTVIVTTRLAGSENLERKCAGINQM